MKKLNEKTTQEIKEIALKLYKQLMENKVADADIMLVCLVVSTTIGKMYNIKPDTLNLVIKKLYAGLIMSEWDENQ